MLPDLDPLLHTQLRLQIVTLLAGVEEGDFNWLLENTGATRGNLSVQINKLKAAEYIEVKKGYKDNYPHTLCVITKKGRAAFEAYVAAISKYIQHKNK
ncbi:winged helix-turn-helix domain-containing protein [Phaeocystidibacter marisrubri]|uniref:Transcriptional regulator n=1 Tax=Phaeocystidibacter marisrubri TaxID=1577780 RepID=A0A6L3ZHL8_9FLAO|nr:transcriptional regulator [Phaeocystidibacter marisrubri]KAB2817351.1 transcriptional regulator [Phaeocystidibacter marisrubri]GGH75786.1 transcriptional regulator [Phaeocystidibacter marisrubri]